MSLFNRISLIQGVPPLGQGDLVIAANDDEQRANEADHRTGENYGAGAAGGTARSSNNAQQPLKDIDAKSGVLIKTLKPGDITNYPKNGDTCTIHYESFTEDEMITSHAKKLNPEPFDSSRSRNQLFQFRLGTGQVIEGIDVAVSKMSVGQWVEATIPYPFGYGVAGYPPIVPPRATLVFRIELIRFSSVV